MFHIVSLFPLASILRKLGWTLSCTISIPRSFSHMWISWAESIANMLLYLGGLLYVLGVAISTVVSTVHCFLPSGASRASRALCFCPAWNCESTERFLKTQFTESLVSSSPQSCSLGAFGCWHSTTSMSSSYAAFIKAT